MSQTKISSFLKPREKVFKPDDTALASYKRLDKIDFSGGIHISNKPTKTNLILVMPGDLVISGINAAKGAVAVWDGDEPLAATIHFSSYMFDKNKIDIDYLKRFLKSPAFVDALKQQAKGGIKTEIKAKRLLSLVVNIPTVEEQKRLNARLEPVDDCFTKIETENANQSEWLKKLRQTILQDAVEGKLSEEWRKKNLANTAQRTNNKEQMSKEDGPFALPEGWRWTRFINIGILKRGRSKNRPRNEKSLFVNGKYPFVQTGDVSAANSTSAVLTTANNYYNKKGLQQSEMQKAGTLCITIAANIAECGLLGFDACVPDSIVCFKSKYQCTDKYVLFFIRTMQKYLEKIAPATAQKNINLKILNSLDVPLPPLAEQQYIVERVDGLLGLISKLEQQAAQRKTYGELLAREIMREAFEGERK
jgi:type I restriction enzyme S subunit